VPTHRSATAFAHRRPHRRRQGSDALGGEDSIEGGGELRVSVADEELELPDAAGQVYQQVAGLLGHPHPSRAGGHHEDVDLAGRQLDHQQHVPTLEQDRVDVEDVGGQDRFALRRTGIAATSAQPGVVPGALPARLSSSHSVLGATLTPSRASSPWMRR